ncbi:MAG: hypothetical protein AAFP89_20445 [Bacteroidota bacterium]
MKNSIRVWAFLSLIASIVLSACSLQEERVWKDKDLEEGTALRLQEKYKFLEFASQEILDATYQDMFLTQGKSIFLAPQPTGFVSQKRAFDQIDSDEAYQEIANNLWDHPYRNFLYVEIDPASREMEAQRVVASPLMAHLVSQDGLLKVGTSLRKYTPKKLLIVENPTDAMIDRMIEWDGTSELDFGVVTDIITEGVGKNANTRGLEGECINQYTKNGRNFRVIGRQRSTLSAPGNDVEREWFAETKHQRRRFQIWFGNDDAVLDLTFNGTYQLGASGIFTNAFQQSLNVTGESSVELLIASCRAPQFTGTGDVSPCESGFDWGVGTSSIHGAEQGNKGDECTVSVN